MTSPRLPLVLFAEGDGGRPGVVSPASWAARSTRRPATSARFMQLADAHGWPLIAFVDTPGFMVGPASEATAMVRRAAWLFVTAANLRAAVRAPLPPRCGFIDAW